jgi:hypothetical protein
LYVREYLAFNADVYKVAKKVEEMKLCPGTNEVIKNRTIIQRIQATVEVSRCLVT